MILKKLKTDYLTFSSILLIIAMSLMLSACSPHPGAGNWQADADNTLNVSSIKVIFEGTADFYSDDNEDSILRCFWSASDKNTLQMQCVHAEDTDKKETYEFTVTETGQGKLTQNEQLIGLFSKQK